MKREEVIPTREAWLLRAARLIHTEILLNRKIQGGYCISVGFPKGRHGRGRAVGQCWPPADSADGKAHIFISPDRGPEETEGVLATVLHELVHAEVGCAAKHRGEFIKVARAAGLTKPWTQSNPSEELTACLNTLAEKLGPYPHGALVPKKIAKPPGSRLRLWECDCGVKVRVASDEFMATCGECDGTFERVG